MPPNFEVLLLRHRDAQAALACGASPYWRLVQILGKGKAGRATAASIRAYVASLEAEAEAPKAA